MDDRNLESVPLDEKRQDAEKTTGDTKEEKKQEDEEVTCVADIVGQWGRFQTRAALIYIVVYIVAPFQNLGITYYTDGPDFRCKKPPGYEVRPSFCWLNASSLLVLCFKKVCRESNMYQLHQSEWKVCRMGIWSQLLQVNNHQWGECWIAVSGMLSAICFEDSSIWSVRIHGTFQHRSPYIKWVIWLHQFYSDGCQINMEGGLHTWRPFV